MSLQEKQKNTLVAALDFIGRDFNLICNNIPSSVYTLSQDQSSIGAHQRHVLEFLEILAHNVAENQIDYESRKRNKLYEQDAVLAAMVCKDVIEKIQNTILTKNLSEPLSILESPGFGLERIAVTSTISREVLFAIQHSTHHFAMIKMIAAKHKISLPENFGVTSATQTHLEQVKQLSVA